MNTDFQERLKATQSILSGITIPAQLAIIKDLMAEQAKEDPDMQRITDIIGSDVRISAATIKRANSPFFGARGKIGSIQHAVLQLGYRNVFCVVMSLSLQAASSFIKGQFMQDFWARSNAVAGAALFLARKLRLTVAPDEAYVAGLFMNCGIPLLSQRFKDYEEVYSAAQASSERKITDVENEKYGSDHAIVGYVVCKSWDLPEEHLRCVLLHHDLTAATLQGDEESKKTIDMLTVVKLAEHAVNIIRETPDVAEWADISEAVLANAGIDAAKLNSLVGDVKEMLQDGGADF